MVRASASLQLPPAGAVRAVLFDIDGTLTDSDGLHLNVFQSYLRELGFVPPRGGDVIDAAFFREHISGCSNEELFARLFPGASMELCAARADEKEARFRALAAETLRPLPGLVELTAALKSRGVECCAVTNAPRLNAEMMLKSLGLWEFFADGERLVIGAECTRPKPYADPFLEGLRRTGAEAKNALGFEDSPSGLRAAVAAGLPTFAITTTQAPDLLLSLGAVATIADFRDPAIWAVVGAERPRTWAGVEEANA